MKSRISRILHAASARYYSFVELKTQSPISEEIATVEQDEGSLATIVGAQVEAQRVEQDFEHIVRAER